MNYSEYNMENNTNKDIMNIYSKKYVMNKNIIKFQELVI